MGKIESEIFIPLSEVLLYYVKKRNTKNIHDTKC